MNFGPYEEHDLLDLIADWHVSKCNRTLHEYLGWTPEQYKHWVETNEQPT